MAGLLDSLPSTILAMANARDQRAFAAREAELQRQAAQQLQDSRIAAQLEQQGLINSAAMERVNAQIAALAERDEKTNQAALDRQNSAQQFTRNTQEQDRALRGAIGLRKSIGGGLPSPSQIAQAQGYAATLSRLNPEDENLKALANTSQPEAWQAFGLGMLTDNYDYERLAAANQNRAPGLQSQVASAELAGRKAASPAVNSVAAFDKALGVNADMPIEQQIEIARANPEKFSEAANAMFANNPALLSQIRGRPGVRDDSSVVTAVNGDRLLMAAQPRDNYMMSPTGDLINLGPGDTAPPDYQKPNNVPLTVGAGPASDPSATPLQLDIGQAMRVINAARQTTNPDVAVAGSLQVMEDAVDAIQRGVSEEELESLLIRAQSLDTPGGQQQVVDKFFAEQEAIPQQMRDAFQRGLTQERNSQQQERLRPYQESKQLSDAMTAESQAAVQAYETTTGEASAKAAIEEGRRQSGREKAIARALEDNLTSLNDILTDQGAGITDPEFGEAYKETRQFGLPGGPQNIADEFMSFEATPGSLKQAVIDTLFNYGPKYGETLGFGKKAFERY